MGQDLSVASKIRAYIWKDEWTRWFM
jgi:hypothetical protein